MMKKKELCIDFKLDLKICDDEVDTQERTNIETAFKNLLFHLQAHMDNDQTASDVFNQA